MAESVDALVSNTSGVTPVPVRPRLWVRLKVPIVCFSNGWLFYSADLFSEICYYLWHHFSIIISHDKFKIKDEDMIISFDGKRAVNNMTGLGNYSRRVIGALACPS